MLSLGLSTEVASGLGAGLALVASYLLGSLPFGLILGRVLRGVDIREAGSKNIGATNAGRVLGRPFGLAAFALDFGKGLVPVLWFAPWASALGTPGVAAVACAVAAVVGHVWPVYLAFRGGKAVATSAGAIVALDPWVFLFGGAVWLVTLGLSRMVSLSSMLMAAAFPVLFFVRQGPGRPGLEAVLATTVLAILIVRRHRANIARIIAGTEPRIGGHSRGDDTDPEG